MKLTALITCLFALVVPAAHADGVDQLNKLAQRHLRPAPLVPTAAPPSLSPILHSLALTSSRGRNSYSLRLIHESPKRPDAIIALARGDFRTLHAALADARLARFKPRRTRIRGHSGYLFTGRRGGLEWLLAWKEDGAIYELGTGTPKTVSLTQLRATADGLDQIAGSYSGGGSDLSGQLTATTHTVSGEIDFATGVCPRGSARFAMLPLTGNTFAVPFSADIVQPPGWSGTLGGTVSSSTIVLGAQLSDSSPGFPTCTSAPLSATLRRSSAG